MSQLHHHGYEFRRPFSRSELLKSDRVLEITATREEREALAARLGVPAIRALEAKIQIVPWRRNGLAVSGRFHAVVVQTCVVSLEDFDATIEQEFTARYTDADDPVLKPAEGSEGEIVVDPLGDDEPEILIEGGADLGELVAENLATALDPHPRKPGSDFQEVLAELPSSRAPSGDDVENPFAVLRHLKRSDDKR